MSAIETGLHSPRYAALPPIFYRVVAPQPLENAHWAAISPDCARLLGLDPARDFDHDTLAVLAGSRPPARLPPLATAYSGHQFGVWAGQLGDGRALLLGERDGQDGQRHEIQLKGAGSTPFSRMGDGRAVLRSSIREFLCSEAMAGLGIPTSRALVIAASARLVADWQAVGFCHGVLNTDNMSILGLTLDYGPFGFLDGFDPEHICNHSDHQGRYAFRRQPHIVYWNLQRLAAALWPLIREERLLQALETFQPTLEAALANRMQAKLGLRHWQDDDWTLLTDLLDLMAAQGADHTLTWRRLCAVTAHGDDPEHCRDLFFDRASFDAWRQRYAARLQQDGQPDALRSAAMRQVNPCYVLRNHLAELAIQAAQEGNYQEIDRLRACLSDPFTERPEYADYASLPPDWAHTLSVSCSS